jgi:transposase-like protein
VAAYEAVKKTGKPVGAWASKNGIWLNQITTWRQQRERGLLLVKGDRKRSSSPPAPLPSRARFSKARKAVSSDDKIELDQTLAKAQAVLNTNEALRKGVREILSLFNKIPFRA